MVAVDSEWPTDEDDDVIGDDQLRLIFTCCHPALAPNAQVALTLDVTRPDPWEAVDIERAAKTKNTFYAYRAAVRWSALERATVALRVFKNTKDQSAKKAAYASMLSAAA